MKQKLNIIILAAGKGTRMQSHLPKVLHPVGGVPILQRVVDEAQQLKPSKIILVYGYGGETVKAHFKASDIVWLEQSEQLGTGHAVMQALPALEANAQVLVLLGDVPLIQQAMCQQLLTENEDGLGILSCKKVDPTGYGRIIRESGQVKAIVEHKDATEAQHKIDEVNTGIMCMPATSLKNWLSKINSDNAQQEYYLTDIVQLAVDEGSHVNATMITDEWAVAGVNSKQDLAAIERALQTRQALALMQSGVTLHDPSRIDIRGQLLTGKDVTIDIGCVFEGEVTLGDNVSIGPYSVIKNSHIQAGSQIQAYSHIEDATVGHDCRVGPYARLRPGADLKANNHIGNFVEIKNATIDDGSKVNHLSYIGDAAVGKGVNVGAGTITCNYDGANKFKTIIEDNAFIGSDSQLVAPVTIKQGSTIGAGSTITQDTPADSLTICRAKTQVTIQGWQRPVKQKKAN